MCMKHGLGVYEVAPAEERGPRGPPVTLLYSECELHALYRALEQRVLTNMQEYLSSGISSGMYKIEWIL